MQKTIRLTQRAQFIQQFAQRFEALRYAWLKFFYDSPRHIPAHTDIDLVVERAELPAWEAQIGEFEGLKKGVFTRKQHATYAQLYFIDGSYLELDLIHSIRWKQWVYMRAEEVLAAAQLQSGGLKLAALKHDFEYLCLFYCLNGAPIPSKYLDYFATLPQSEQPHILEHLSHRFGLGELLPGPEGLQNYRAQLLRYLKSLPENRGISRWRHSLQYWRDVFGKPQPMISFSGVDGAGKTTVLECVRELLQSKYRRNIVMRRQRPSLLPILSAYKYGKKAAEARAANSLPRQGQNNSRLSSLLRFAYYFADYVIGQWVIYWKYSRRGKLLLYDRYYFDFLADPRRANLVISPSLVSWLYRWIHKPQLNILLYAPPATILARKQELSQADIQALTQAYLKQFEQLQKRHPHIRYLPIENTELDKTLQLIEAAYLDMVLTD